MFVPHGCEPTPAWLQAHPGAIKIPAVMVPRDPRPGESGTQWNVQLDLPNEPPATPTAAAPETRAGFAPIGRPGKWPVDRNGRPWPRSRFGQPMCPIDELPPGVRKPGEATAPDMPGSGDPVAAWRTMNAVFADPGRFAGIVASDSGQRGVQYAEVSRNVKTDASQTDAPPRPVYIFVGGYKDDVYENVWNYYIDFESKHPGQAFYFSQAAPERIKDFIASLPKGTPVNLIGHSYGADTAAKIFESSTGKINTLITIDPVSWGRPDFAVVRSHTNVWIDVDATPTEHMEGSNVAAALGGDWGSAPKNAVTTYIKAVENHAEFTKMMRTKGPDGRTPEQILLGQ